MYQYLNCLLLSLTLLTIAPAVAQSGTAVDADRGIVRLAMSAEPPTLNSIQATDRLSAFVLQHTNEGLSRYDRDNNLVPAVAERWELDDQGVRFWLRREAMWEDGRPVTSADFLFAWRQVLRPETASRYASLLFPIRNARAVNAGRKPVTELGIRAPDPYRLEVDFDEPCAYFPALAAFTTLLPVNEAFYREQGERFAADAGRLLANGPFRLGSWVHGASLRLDANRRWHKHAQLRLTTIDIPYISSDSRALMNLFRDRRIAIAQLDEQSLNDALVARQRLRKFADGSLTFLRFNMRPGRPTADPLLRRAIQAAVDNSRLVNRVVRSPGARATDSLFPSVVRGIDGRLNDEFPLPPPPRGQALAQRYLQQLAAPARQRLQQPGLDLLVSDTPVALRVAEYLQATLMARLGISLRIDRQTFKQRLQKANAGKFDLEISNWSPDFDDPITYGGLFASWNPNNRGRYASANYDHWVDVAQSTTDQARRMAAMDELQKLIVEEVPIVPLYESAVIYLQHPRLEGVVRSLFGGDPNLIYAWIRDA